MSSIALSPYSFYFYFFVFLPLFFFSCRARRALIKTSQEQTHCHVVFRPRCEDEDEERGFFFIVTKNLTASLLRFDGCKEESQLCECHRGSIQSQLCSNPPDYI